jgi:hypothetical protein
MRPLITVLIVCAALVMVYPPVALAIFALGAIVTGCAAWSKARARRARERPRSDR